MLRIYWVDSPDLDYPTQRDNIIIARLARELQPEIEHPLAHLDKLQDKDEEILELKSLAKENNAPRGFSIYDNILYAHRMTTYYSEGQLVLVKALNVSIPATKRIAKFMPLYEGPYRVRKTYLASLDTAYPWTSVLLQHSRLSLEPAQLL